VNVPYDHRPLGMTREEYERRWRELYGARQEAKR